MDGNGRWAKARHRPRIFGHQAGVKTVKRIVEDASEIGIKCLTLYSFSTENWSRPKAEVSALFGLLKQYVETDLEHLHSHDVKIRILGSRAGLPSDISSIIERVEARTKDNSSFALNIAFNYGGRDEIIRAVAKAARAGEDVTALTNDIIANYLDTAGIPEPDLIIRTSGEHRTSNFLMWQSAYAEYCFSDVLWPDFTRDHLLDAIEDFQKRDRRFGNLAEAEVA
ncbi:MAG: di-trans,poly-cis-decaprenylcistransferase [Hellea sp.]|nr:di-trans,poly-cis-decaprenylcistransferase [Hellea sp.]